MSKLHHTLSLSAPFVVIVFLVVGALSYFNLFQDTPPDDRGDRSSLATFASCNAIQDALEESQRVSSRDLLYEIASDTPVAATSDSSKSSAFSSTNVQVEGVDEADIVKTDGTFIYTLSAGGKLSIARVYPPTTSALRSQTELGIQPSDLFLDGDRLIVIGSSSPQILTENLGEAKLIAPDFQTFTAVQIWDVTDRNVPKKIRTIEFEGIYATSRMIDSDMYLVTNNYPDYRILDLPTPAETDIIPLYRDSVSGATSFTAVTPCGEVAYFPDVIAEQFITISSLDVSDDDSAIRSETILGSGQNVYASLTSLYVAASTYHGDWWLGLRRDEEDTVETSTIHAFGLHNGDITYRGKLEAPGHVLNQFSMDEHDGFFRIATTTGQVSRENVGTPSTSGIYTYDQQLQQAGKLEGLAPGEQIYSARFIGERAYVVTFQKVDPLFVIDLADPAAPTLLGKLKIPGYSDYLHPYDENHIIGLGKDAVAADEGNFAWYQGVKLALFDVTDVENPRELHKVIIGDRGTDSYALHDHKAFLFDKDKNLLSIPVLLAEMTVEQRAGEADPSTYGEFIFQGAYVYTLTLENGFTERGRITHYTSDDAFKKSGYYYYGDGNSIKRSLYIGDYLYTISDNRISMNALADLGDRGTITLCSENCENQVYVID